MKLDQYISELLFEHECVIIPGFGGIVANYRPSFLNPAHHTFSPPSKRLAFNASLRTNDGLLASHLSKRLSVNYSEANNYITAFVSDCTRSLQDGQKLVLDKVGVLYLDGEKNLQFMPDASANYLKSSFGLTALHSPAIRRDDGITGTEKPTRKRTVVKIGRWRIMEVIPVAAILTYLIINPAVVTSLNQQVASLNPFPKPVVVHYDKKDSAKDKSSAVFNDETVFANKETEAAVEKDTVNYQQEVFAETTPEVKTPEVTTPEKTTPEVKKKEAPVINLKPNTITQADLDNANINASIHDLNSKETASAEVDKTQVKKETVSNATNKSRQYYVIGGCFSIEENATKFLQESLANGYKAEIIGKNPKGMTMVSLFSTTDATIAEQELTSIKRKNPGGAWMFRK